MFSSKLYSREKGKVNSTEHYSEQDLDNLEFTCGQSKSSKRVPK